MCQKSFLSLWSYSNLFTDRGRKNGKGVGKELCDLLVIFENDIILFSDKNSKFGNSPDIEVSWRRWFKKTVIKSSCQLYGAERWLRQYPDRIFLDPHCNSRFPFKIPNPSKLRVHRIAVALGAHDACKAFFGGSSLGSLVIDSGLVGDDHYKMPFYIGQPSSTKGFVHIFDNFTLDAVLLELDTISDFISYLTKKEKLLKQKRPLITATGEEQLLAIYLTHLNDKGEHDFKIPDEELDGVFFDESFWEGMVNNPQYVAKQNADKISYVWDRLIEHFISYANVHISSDPRENQFDALEKALRIMAAEPRIGRRQLGHALIDLRKTAEPRKGKTRLVVSNDFPKVAYVFLILPLLDGRDYQEYRESRKYLLMAYCKVAKLKAIKSEFIVGVAMDPSGSKGATEDLVVLEVSSWTNEKQKEAESLQKNLSLFLNENIKYTETHYQEYPDI